MTATRKASAPKATTTTKAPGKAVAVRPTAPVAKKAAPKAAPAKITAPTVDLSARVESARSAGFSRRFLTEESGLTGTTAIWRTDRLGTEEAGKLATLLDRIESGKVPAPVRAAGSGRPSLKHRVDEATKLLATAYQSKTVADARKLITEAIELLG
jgi:hypothetical protein